MRTHALPVIVIGVSGGHVLADIKNILSNIRDGRYVVNVLAVHNAPVGKEQIDDLFDAVCAQISDHHAKQNTAK